MPKPMKRGQEIGEVEVVGLEIWTWTGDDWVRSDIPDNRPNWDQGDASNEDLDEQTR